LEFQFDPPACVADGDDIDPCTEGPVLVIVRGERQVFVSERNGRILGRTWLAS
jgi:hypothetical protein